MSTEQPALPAGHIVFLGLGSNLGDRDAILRAALDGLAPAVAVEAISSVYDTAPLLVEDQPRFHNLVCGGRTVLAPMALLRETQRLQTALGRVPGRRYGPRLIDIDLLLYDDLVLNTPELVIPHPGMEERGFVLIPLAEIAPRVVHPITGKTAAELAAALPSVDVRHLGPLPPRQH
jgi:2-amino-4-hydroxy-6-hydroxymethyldihydropteridine diphosphokinase